MVGLHSTPAQAPAPPSIQSPLKSFAASEQTWFDSLGPTESLCTVDTRIRSSSSVSGVTATSPTSPRSPTSPLERVESDSVFSRKDYNRIYDLVGKYIKEWSPVIQREKDLSSSPDTTGSFRGAAIITEQNPFLEECDKGFKDLQSKHNSKCFSVAVLALCKAGKSTFMNAMMGRDFLPSNNVPETACIVHVKHDPKQPEGLLVPGVGQPVTGKDINPTIKAMNDTARRSGLVHKVQLQTPLVALSGKSFEGSPASFDILDTPGHNEMGGGVVKEQVETVIQTADAILYVMDYSKLKTEEEAGMFDRLRGIRPDLVRDVGARLFIIVNKIDLARKRHGLDFHATKEYVANLVNTSMPEVEMVPERVLPLSAERALLARQIINGTVSESARDDCCEMIFGQDWEGLEIDDAMLLAGAEKLLNKSHFSEMEEAVVSFLFDHSAGIFISSLVADALRRLYTLNNYLHTTKAAITTEHDYGEGLVTRLMKEMKLITTQFEKALQWCECSSLAMELWVEKQLQSFGQDMREYMDVLIDTAVDIKMVSHSADAHKSLLISINKGMADKLSQKFHEFRKELEGTAFQRQKDMFTNLAVEVNPFLDAVGQMVGKLLSIDGELIQAPFVFPEVTIQSFRLDIDQSLNALLVAKTSLFKMIRGWCFKGGVVLDDAVDYYTNLALYKQKWLEKIDENTNHSSIIAKMLVGEHVKASMQHATSYLNYCVDGYMKTVKSALQEEHKSEEKRQARIRYLTDVIDKEVKAVQALQKTAKKWHTTSVLLH